MNTVPMKLLTIVAETVLAEKLVALLRALGVSGYTISDARGQGSRGRRTGEIPGDNVRLETLIGPALADQILEQLATRFFRDYAIVVWTADVGVVRGEKYS